MCGKIFLGIVLVALYPLDCRIGLAFIPPEPLVRARSSGWTEESRRHRHRDEVYSGCSRPRQRRAPRVAVAMQTDTNMNQEAPSSYAAVTPGVPSLRVQFDAKDGSEDVDSFMGELNFCLGPADTYLSGLSTTKALNTACNKMVKNILILNSPEDDGPAMRSAEEIETLFDTEHSGSPGHAEMKAFLSCVCQLAKEGCPSQETLDALDEPYKAAFRRVAVVLMDFGCSIVPGEVERIRPADKDICLSILDYALPDRRDVTTPTRALNTLANRVVRTVCVGSDEDLQALVREMDSKREKFMDKWVGDGWQGSQEDMFYSALVGLLRNGLADEDPALNGAYLNSYQRLMGIVVQEVGTRSTPTSEMVLKSFLSWEREIRKELTEPAWEARPPDLVGSWALEMSGWDGLSDLPLDGSFEAEDLGLNDLVVAFRKDGTVEVPVEKGVGLQWKVEPGPTHLDTVYFKMISAAPKGNQGLSSDVGAAGGTTLSYTGYVDRGARIESRFSKRFVKMTGRMTSVVRGREQPSTRFAMRLVARGEGKGLTSSSEAK